MSFAFARRMCNVAFASVAVAFSMNSSAQAGPLKMDRVAADTQWLAHVDVHGLVNYKLVQYALAHGEELDISLDGLDAMKAQFNIDPLKDILDITVYGNGNPGDNHDAFVAIITATPVVDDFIDALKAQMEAYNTMELAGYTVQTFKSDGEAVFFHVRPGAATANRVILVSSDSERLVRGIAVVDGKAPNLVATKNAALAQSPRAGSLFFAASDGLGWVDREDGDDPASAIFRDTRSIALDLGEADDNTYAEFVIATDNEEKATNIADMMRGFLAMAKMAANSDPELSSMKQLLADVDLKNVGPIVNIKFQHSTQSLIDTLKAVAGNNHAEDEDQDVSVKVEVEVEVEKSE